VKFDKICVSGIKDSLEIMPGNGNKEKNGGQSQSQTKTSLTATPVSESSSNSKQNKNNHKAIDSNNSQHASAAVEANNNGYPIGRFTPLESNHPWSFIPPYMGPHPTYLPSGRPAASTSMMSGLPSFPNLTSNNNDRDMYELIQEMNNRMKTIEKGFSKIINLQSEVTHLKTSVHGIRDTYKSISNKVDDMETFCATVSDITDDMSSHRRKIDSEISELKAKNQYLENEIHNLRQSNTQLKSMCLQVQSRSMANNLLFFGLDEAPPTDNQRENTESVLRTFLRNYIQDNEIVNAEFPVNTDSIKFEKVHRLGNPVTALRNGRRRPIVATFESFRVKEQVRLAGTVLNKSQTVFKIYEHYPREIEERRKVLYPIARKYGNTGAKVSLIRDQLYVNNELYDIDTARFIPARKADQNLDDQARRPISPERNNIPRWRSNSLSREPIDVGRPAQPRIPRFIQASRRLGNAKTLPNYAVPPAPNFETPNRFAGLSQETCELTIQKRKAVSPADNDYAAKRSDIPMDSQDITNQSSDKIILQSQDTIPNEIDSSAPEIYLGAERNNESVILPTDGPLISSQ
jgi:uncharacterized protein YsxB (DUF464 family)